MAYSRASNSDPVFSEQREGWIVFLEERVADVFNVDGCCYSLCHRWINQFLGSITKCSMKEVIEYSFEFEDVAACLATWLTTSSLPWIPMWPGIILVWSRCLCRWFCDGGNIILVVICLDISISSVSKIVECRQTLGIASRDHDVRNQSSINWKLFEGEIANETLSC